MDDARRAFSQRLIESVTGTRAYHTISATLSRGSDATLTIPSFARAAYLAATFLDQPHTMLIVTPTAAEAQKLSTQLATYIEGERVQLLPQRADMPWDLRAADQAQMARRAAAVSVLWNLESAIIVTSTPVWMRRFPSPQTGWSQGLRFVPGEHFEHTELTQRLTTMGYRRQQKADEEGSYSLHGDTLAVYPPYPQRPFMVDFFDTEIESVKTWLVGSGQPIAALPEASLFALEEPESRKDGRVPLSEYVKPAVQVVILEPKAVFDCAVRYDQSLRATARSAAYQQPLDKLFLTPAQLDFGKSARLTLATLAGSQHADAELKARRPHSFSSDDQLLIAVRELVKKGYDLTLALPQPRHRERIRDLLVFGGITVGNSVHIVDLDLSGGYQIEAADFAVLTTAEIYPRAAAANPATPLDPTKLTFAFKPGDYVVHATYGIALFTKVAQRTTDTVTRDYLYLAYSGGDMLYTPVDQIDKISKYVGADGSAPHVTRLGTKAWARATAKARSSAKTLAFDLAELYARRGNIRGYAYHPDTLAQAEMESHFPYEPTTDQHNAILDVKADMESTRPMDRLIIGDVGYGKTEVALRAAFKATQDNKQVMVLCPTTILAQQHFTQFSERLAPFALKVEVLSRFRTPAQQRAALEGFKAGTVHVLIGTHRLLSADVVPHDLGLLIIDEEQRFGVEHKEQLKHIREQIDVLALSATPIPRTLQMSLSGVRDLSVIDTPPAGRSAVTVHVGQYEDDLVTTAIRRELHRRGQVYYISNRVKNIEDAVERVHAAAPEARIAIAHGRMSENELEYVMEQFSAGEVEVLVSTTIVESGIDNPHTNTLIIEDSQRLGLAQLYQLKGRVGRSHTRAYAYFFYPPEDSLTPQALERLAAIAEHDELGSGIKIALRDLEIRGAGSIVGSAQSGQLSAVGFDLFAGMLSSALAELRGTEEVVHPDIRVDIAVPAYFADEYVPDIDQRVLWYRRIAAAKDLDILAAFRGNLIREYGAPPQEAENLFTLARIRLLAAELEAKSVEVKHDELRIAARVSDQTVLDELPLLNATYDKRRHVISTPLRDRGTVPVSHSNARKTVGGENVANATETFIRAILFDME